MYATSFRASRGVERCFGYTVRILDGPDFYIQYKDQFVHRIYQFHVDRPDPLIIDGGSNIGLSVLYFKRAYPKARVIAFEPDPDVFQVLSENMRRNRMDGVTLVNSGLASTADTVAFVQGGSASGHLGADGDVKVKTERLSDYLAEPVDFLKLNIEGYELPVLEETEAAGRLRNVRELVLEYHGWPNGDQRLGKILTLLDRQGFRYLVHDFDRETCGTTKPPFHLEAATMWFCLVYAKRIDTDRSVPTRATDVESGSVSESPIPSAVVGDETPAASSIGNRSATARQKARADRLVRDFLPPPSKKLGRPFLDLVRGVPARLTLGLGVEPRSESYGYNRGTPICRYYMTRFLTDFGADIGGHCLEFQDPAYVPRFGGTRVSKLDILDVDASNPLATIVADLTRSNSLPSDAFDCVVATFVLHLINDPGRAVVELHRILKPGGALLIGVPQVGMCDPDNADFWRFTPEGLRHLLAAAFGASAVTTRAYGNSLTAAGQLRGLAAEDFTAYELNDHDPRFAVQICARAIKSIASAPALACNEAKAPDALPLKTEEA